MNAKFSRVLLPMCMVVLLLPLDVAAQSKHDVLLGHWRPFGDEEFIRFSSPLPAGCMPIGVWQEYVYFLKQESQGLERGKTGFLGVYRTEVSGAPFYDTWSELEEVMSLGPSDLPLVDGAVDQKGNVLLQFQTEEDHARLVWLERRGETYGKPTQGSGLPSSSIDLEHVHGLTLVPDQSKLVLSMFSGENWGSQRLRNLYSLDFAEEGWADAFDRIEEIPRDVDVTFPQWVGDSVLVYRLANDTASTWMLPEWPQSTGMSIRLGDRDVALNSYVSTWGKRHFLFNEEVTYTLDRSQRVTRASVWMMTQELAMRHYEQKSAERLSQIKAYEEYKKASAKDTTLGATPSRDILPVPQTDLDRVKARLLEGVQIEQDEGFTASKREFDALQETPMTVRQSTGQLHKIQVFDSRTYRPVEGASVTFCTKKNPNYFTFTDANGVAEFRHDARSPHDHISVRVLHMDYYRQTTKVNCIPNSMVVWYERVGRRKEKIHVLGNGPHYFQSTKTLELIPLQSDVEGRWVRYPEWDHPMFE